jgi:hypothetical protein
MASILGRVGGEGADISLDWDSAEPERTRSEGGPVCDSVDLGVVPMTAERRHWDQWRGTQFTDSEINKLIYFSERIQAGCDKVDGRLLPREVRRFLLRWNYLEKTKHGLIISALARSEYAGRWLPVEAIWRVVSPMLGPNACTVSTSSRSVGYSIRKHAGWKTLGCWTAEERHFGECDQREMEESLGLLALHGYIWFLQSGTVWEITERKDRTI